MALSFEESKQQLIQQNETVARPMMMTARMMATESFCKNADIRENLVLVCHATRNDD